MTARHSDEFKRDAVRIALTSGLTRRQVASDRGIGLRRSTRGEGAVWEGIAQKKDLAIRALNMVIALQRPSKGCIQHTDRGSRYYSQDDQKFLRQNGLTPSRSGKGNCSDNAAVETFFKTLKAEMIWRRAWPTRRDVELALFQYSNGF